MDNSSYRSQYIASDTAKVSEQSANAVIAFWRRVAKAEGEIGKSLEDGYSRAEYIELISKLNITSPNVLLPTKSRIGKYLKWLREKGVLEKSMSIIFMPFDTMRLTQIMFTTASISKILSRYNLRLNLPCGLLRKLMIVSLLFKSPQFTLRGLVYTSKRHFKSRKMILKMIV